MELKERPEIPEEKIIKVNNIKKIDFSKPYKFIYFEWWFQILTLPFYLACYFIVWLCSIHFRFRVVKNSVSRKVLRKQGCITVSNHCHYFDTVLTSFLFFPRRLYVSVVQRNFEVPKIRYILRMLKAFPIPASSIGFKMIAEPIGKALARKYHVHFLPEGNLSHLSQTIHKFKLGAFYQSCLHQSPVVPMVYVLQRRKLFGRQLSTKWLKITCVFGEPHYPPPLTDEHNFPRAQLKEMAEKVADWMENTLASYHGNEKETAC